MVTKYQVQKIELTIIVFRNCGSDGRIANRQKKEWNSIPLRSTHLSTLNNGRYFNSSHLREYHQFKTSTREIAVGMHLPGVIVQNIFKIISAHTIVYSVCLNLAIGNGGRISTAIKSSTNTARKHVFGWQEMGAHSWGLIQQNDQSEDKPHADAVPSSDMSTIKHCSCVHVGNYFNWSYLINIWYIKCPYYV